MLYLLTPRDADNPRWQSSKIVQPVQVYASTAAAARDLALVHLSTGPDGAGPCPWLDAGLCEITELDELIAGIAVIGEYGLVLPGARFHRPAPALAPDDARSLRAPPPRPAAVLPDPPRTDTLAAVTCASCLSRMPSPRQEFTGGAFPCHHANRPAARGHHCPSCPPRLSPPP